MVNVKMLPYSQGILVNSIVLFVHYSKETDIPGYELFMAAILWVTFIYSIGQINPSVNFKVPKHPFKGG